LNELNLFGISLLFLCSVSWISFYAGSLHRRRKFIRKLDILYPKCIGIEELDPKDYAIRILGIYQSHHWKSLKEAVAVLERVLIDSLIYPKNAELIERKEHTHGGIYWLRELIIQIEAVAVDQIKKVAKEVKNKKKKQERKLRSRKLTVPSGT